MRSQSRIQAENTKFLYDYKFDLAEVNRFNYRFLVRDYFHLTTKKITYMAVILALNLVLTIFSRYVLGLVPIAGFFVIEISFVTVLIFALNSNFLYSFIFLETTIWFRLLLGSEPIGLVAMNLTDGAYLIVFCLTLFLFKRFAVLHQLRDWTKKLFYYEILMVFIISLITGAIAVLLNYSFLLQWYFPEWEKKQVLTLLPAIFGLNLVKYFINGFFYLIAFKPLITLARHYQI